VPGVDQPGTAPAGGALPGGWRQLARVLDVAAVCESPTPGQLADQVIADLVDLIRAITLNPGLQVK
jgi:hypothetical protein